MGQKWSGERYTPSRRKYRASCAVTERRVKFGNRQYDLFVFARFCCVDTKSLRAALDAVDWDGLRLPRCLVDRQAQGMIKDYEDYKSRR